MKRINITLDEKTFQKAKIQSNNLGISLSAYIRMLINSN